MKAIFVVDMPKNCLECEFCGYIADIKDGFRSCFLNKHCFEERYAEEEYLMCPLRPLPKKMKRRATDEATDLIYSTGWNDCLDEILGEENE